MQRPRILLIEDEPDILDVLEYNLRRDGFDVVSRRNGEEGWSAARTEHPELILLDLMLPGIDGLEICRRLKADVATRAIPIVMVTAKGEESDIVLGLGLGADDYITKPFSPKEVVARVQAVLRRGSAPDDDEPQSRVKARGVEIDVERHQVLVDGESVACTATELRLLHFLASHPGRVYTRDQLISRVIGQHAVVLDRTIDVHIRAIRQKLGPYRDLVETIRGVGYRFQEHGR